MSCNTEEHHKESSDVARHTAGWPHPNMLTWPCPLYYVLRIRTIVSCRARQKNTTRRAVMWPDTLLAGRIPTSLSSLLRSSDSDDRIMSCNTEEHHKESSDVARHTAGWPHPNMLTWPCPLYYVHRIRTIVSCRARQKNITRRSVMWPNTLLAGRIPTC
ncbi:hypothetical protein J6590_099519 [Homalodisca vitripennis]|nr:hypothetical protein J6590_099519 [Homalodisca vitripennis]